MDPNRWEIAFIDGQRVARLATIDPHGWPQMVPIVFAFDGQRLFTPIDAKPKRVGPAQLQRVRNIQKNPNVAVLFDVYDEDWSRLAWVQMRGLATFVESGPERDEGIALLEARYYQYQGLPLNDSPVILIRVQHMISWRANSK